MTTNLTKLPLGYLQNDRPMGFFPNMPEAEYHAVKAFSYSGSKEFAKSPAHFKAYGAREWEPDADREKFKAVHLLCLEPDTQSRIVVKDGTWAGKVKAEVQELQKQGFIVLKQKALEEAKNIAETVRSHSLAGLILSQSLPEVSLFWDEDGVYCKARIDILSITAHGIVLGDLKNFGSLASEHLIGYQIAQNRYHWQMAFYGRGIEKVFGAPPIKRYWVFVEEKAPHGIKIRNCNDAASEAGWLAISQMLPRYQECLEDEVWPSYKEDEEDADLPDFAFQVVGGIDE
jgi:hypothetical protein